MESLRGFSTVEAAKGLLGWILERDLPGGLIRGRITETEAYLTDDPASHSFRGITPRNRAMFGPSGQAYVYFTYGMHFCLNVVTSDEGIGEAVLIRSLEILSGHSLALANRGGRRPLAEGPGRLCQALAIDLSLNGHDLSRAPLRLLPGNLDASEIILAGPRIGIRQAVDLPYRLRLVKADPENVG